MPQLINTSATNFTGGSASVNHIINTPSSQLTEDLLVVSIYLGAPKPTITTPTGWTLINTVTSLIGGRYASYYKIALTDGSESVNFVSSVPTFGTSIVANVRNAYLNVSPIDNFSFQTQSSSVTYTPASVTAGPNATALIFGLADDTTLRTWSTSPSLTQQAISFAVEVSQMVAFTDVQVSFGATPAYAVSKTGGATSGMAEAIWIRQRTLTIVNPPSTAATVGAAYSSFPVVTGGDGSYIYSITSGSLPTGLSLNASTGEILGTPTVAGTFPFRLHVADGSGNTTFTDTSILVSAFAYTPTTPHPIEFTVGDVAIINISLVSGVVQYVKFNGALYAIGANVIISSNLLSPRAFKSVDDGVTWTSLDTAHEVNANSTTMAFFRGTKIWLLTQRVTDSSFRVISFDVLTEIWGTQSTQATSYFIANNFVQINILSDGSLVISYERQTSPAIAEVITYNGSWSVPAQIFNHANASYVVSATVDASDRVWILCIESIASGSPNTTNVYKFAVGSLTGPTTVQSAFVHGINFGAGTYVATYDEIRFPTASLFTIDGNTHLQYIKGTPSSAPVWSIVDVIVDNNLLGGFTNQLSFAYQIDSDICLVWLTELDSTNGQEQVVYVRQRNNGAWDAVPSIVWDSLADPLIPPSPFPGDVVFLGAQMVDSPNAKLGAVLGLFQNLPVFGGFCGVLYYVAASLVGDVTLIFDLHGGAGGLELVTVQPPGGGPPGPILTPTQCVNQT